MLPNTLIAADLMIFLLRVPLHEIFHHSTCELRVCVPTFLTESLRTVLLLVLEAITVFKL